MEKVVFGTFRKKTFLKKYSIYHSQILQKALWLILSCQRNSEVRCLLPSGPRNLVNSGGKKTCFLFAFVPLSVAANLGEEKGEGIKSQITREREAPRLKNSSGAASASEGREAREDAGPHWVSDTLEPLVRASRVTVSRGFGAEDEHEAKRGLPQRRSTSWARAAGEGLPGAWAPAAGGRAGRPVAVAAALPRCDRLSGAGRHRKRGVWSAWLKRGLPEAGLGGGKPENYRTGAV